MNKQAILVTGGAGFIGSHLSEKLLSQGKKVVCLDNFNNFYSPQVKKENIKKAQKNKNYILIKGDILNEKLLDKIFSQYNIQKIVHLAALAGVRPSLASPQDYIETDIIGTVNLLQQARKYNIEQFIFASSSSVYGTNKKIPFKEKHPTENQISPYACAKKAAEIYCKTYHRLYNLPVTILRYFTVYGPRQRPEMAIHKFTRLILKDKEIPMYGDGTSERDYTYIDDALQGTTAAIERKFDFEIFNIGNSQTTELRKLISIIEKETGKKANIKKLPPQPGDVPLTYADISKAKKMLGYNPKVSIEQGVGKFVNWYKKNSQKLFLVPSC